MTRFIQGEPRTQTTIFPKRLEDFINDDNPARVMEAFVDELNIETLDFHGMIPKVTGRPTYHPSTTLKLYTYCYLNRIQSTRRQEPVGFSLFRPKQPNPTHSQEQDVMLN